MKRKWDKKTTPGINNTTYIQELNIDYDKLADAIVKAQSRARELQNSEVNNKRLSFFKALKSLWKGKASDGRSLTAPFAMVLSFMFKGLSVLLAVFLIALWVVTFSNPEIVGIWSGRGTWFAILYFITLVCITVVLGIFWMVFHGASTASIIEKDPDNILGAFSGMVSFVSLVIALIALLQ